MSEVGDALYQKALIEKAREARSAPRLDDADVTLRLDNPLCGDRVELDLKLANGHVGAIGHKVRGCALCQAAAVILAERAPGKPPEAVHAVLERVRAYLAEGRDLDLPDWPELELFLPVRPARSRHRCVTLPFEALVQALDRMDQRQDAD
ncbi:iron-sulfur cluster assembly scaffold protein [Marinivivus vitaminiproducens]|uniref:iron-sulfur cluster assembly scaffold protein n=1 Tax=Marinivivus vitaminiproducens TaxID=3035935 RepID=UPI00279833EB|nr:iron-sulfur cluster assembly scaffold protein [Geminicoccaceae bacterium SCSIO 64248]